MRSRRGVASNPMTTTPHLPRMPFTDSNILAIFADKKRQTRRIPCAANSIGWKHGLDLSMAVISNHDHGCCLVSGGVILRPKLKPGDRVAATEAFQWAASMGVCNKADDYLIYRATDPDWSTTEGWKWRPPMFMKADYSRLTLEITEVRAQKIQEISHMDSMVEGCSGRIGFSVLWDSINKTRSSWESNGPVWAYTFRRVK